MSDAQPPFELTIIPVTPFQQNASLIVETGSRRAAVVDPGGDLDSIEQVIAQTGARVEKILLTHGHIDHAAGAAELKERLEAATGRTIPIEGPHKADAHLMADFTASSARFGIPARPVASDRWLVEGDTVTLGDITFDVLHIPGHSPGSVVLVDHAHGFAFMGDVLFAGSVGRTDLPGGSHDDLIAGIKAKLMPLPDELVFLPGHGQASTIGRERASNPYIV